MGPSFIAVGSDSNFMLTFTLCGRPRRAREREEHRRFSGVGEE
jgi:hypothetical protein